MTSEATTRRHDVLRAAMTLDDQLDDIKRAQIWSQLEDRLAAPAPARRSWLVPFAAAAAAAALTLLWLLVRTAHPAARTLSAPADTTLATALGPHARAELVGPASLELLEPAGDATAVHLTRGTLLAEFTGGPGRSLRIETREAVVEIVGTLFSVEARDGATCVSVAHGKVRVTTRTTTLAIAGGESWCSTEAAVTPIQPAAHDPLERFEAVITARAGTPAPPSPAAAPAEPPVQTPAQPLVQTPAQSPVVALAQPPVQTPARPPVQTPARPPVQTPARPPVQTPARPPVAVAAQPPVVTATPARADAFSPVHAPSASPSSASRADHGSNDRTNESREETTAPAAAPHDTPSPLRAVTAPGDPTPSADLPTPHTEAAPPPAELPAPPAKPAPAPAVAATPESLYEAAEAALAHRDSAGADRILARLLTDFPHASLADQALLERARIAYDRHAWRDAQHDLDQLAAIATTPLAEPGAYLSCRIALAAQDGAAEHCLTEYRKTYPKSPHDLDVLGVLTDLAYQRGGCERARPRIDELLRAYSHTTLAHAWVARCPEGK